MVAHLAPLQQCAVVPMAAAPCPLPPSRLFDKSSIGNAVAAQRLRRRSLLVLDATARALALSQHAVGSEDNQAGQSCALARRDGPPPMFRLATFLLEDEPVADGRPADAPPTPQSPAEDQASASPRISNGEASPTRRKRTQVECVCREIVETEESYVAALESLLLHFFEPLQQFAEQQSIALGAMAALHTSTRTILHIHLELLRMLRADDADDASDGREPASNQAASDHQHDMAADPFREFPGTLGRIARVSKAFQRTIEYMKVYAFYCASYLSAKNELGRLQLQNPPLNRFTMELYDRARESANLDIISSLIKPVQRICRYPLLFRELLKNAATPEETLILQQSLAKIEAVSAHVNEKVREAQNNARLYQLHESLHPSAKLELIQPSRTLLCETMAFVTSLDAPRWPKRLLRYFRRRRRGRRKSSDVSSRRRQLEERLSALFTALEDDRRGSATVTATATSTSMTSTAGGMLSPSAAAAMHSMRSSLSMSQQPSAAASSTAAPASSPLLRRRSSGERMRLILLSDMLLMGKKREQQLKIRRQICLSCAIVHDESDVSPTQQPEAAQDADATAPTSASFSLEVSKVGRCNCHHFSPLTLRRSPTVGSLAAMLASRRSSLSFSASAGDLLDALETDAQPQPPTQAPPGSQRSSVSGLRAFRRLEQLASFRKVKRYLVTCDTPQRKAEFVLALRQAIARSARLTSLCAAAEQSRSSLHLLEGGAKALAIAARLPTKIWHSLRGGDSASAASSLLPPDDSSTNASAIAPDVAEGREPVPAKASTSESNVDLLHLHDPDALAADPRIRAAHVV
ncbi:hypothetical protein P43SY_006692 [Pythium insidiosum]|uniref:DH domain-containing protein n=1 Tax=Pythium insidiosum TaxID=114742 RepID=A0AAD5LTB8_PYTIN|nr:hypothetical protein P43SY_006692 [Pythium insidiosum]